MLARVISAAVARRFAAVGLVLAVAAFGFFGFQQTSIEAFPDVTNLQVNVIGQLPGLAPEEVEKQLTIPLERVLGGIPGAIGMRSESLFGLSLIAITFDDGTDAFRSRALVAERLGQADTPDGAEVRLAPDATPLGKIFQYRVTSDRHDLTELRSWQEWTIARALRTVPGVAEAFGNGGFLKEWHVEVDPLRLEAAGLGFTDVADAIEASSLNVGGGVLRSNEQDLLVRGIGLAQTPADIAAVVIEDDAAFPLTVGDVARIVQSSTPRLGSVGYGDAIDAVEGVVLLRRGENPSKVLAGVNAKVAELNAGQLPTGMQIEPFYDRTALVSGTLRTVYKSLLEGFILIVAVVWLFLRTIRGSLVVAAVIPLSLLMAFGGLYLLGLPANLISMGAIDFGILVDGAVVLVEAAVHRAKHNREQDTDEGTEETIVRASIEVARPTMYAMAIIIAALLPVFTLERVEGRIFRPLALTYSLALVGALVLALVFVPAVLSVVMKKREHWNIEEPGFVLTLRALHQRWLTSVFAAPRRWVGAFVVALCGAVGVGATLGSEFIPQLDEGDFTVFVEMPPSVGFPVAQQLLLETRQRILTFPEVLATVTEHGRPEDGTDNEGVTMGVTTVRLKPREQWRAGVTKADLIGEMRTLLMEIPGVRFNFSQPIRDRIEESGSGVRGQVVLKIYGNELPTMRAVLEQAKTAIAGIDGVVDLDLYRETTAPQLQIVVDRTAIAREGLAMQAVQELIAASLAGTVKGEVWQGERLVPVRVRLPRQERADVERIGDLTVLTPRGARIPLRELASITIGDGRATINRENNTRTMALKFNVDGRDLGSVIAEAQQIVGTGVVVPEGHRLQWSGEFENQRRAVARLQTIVPVALVIVFGLLASALSSVRGAVVILATAPFALVGGVVALKLSGIVLSVSAAVGFIALLGQASLAGLLVISAIDVRRADVDAAALDADPALLTRLCVDGASERVRAVFMTGLLAMLGLLPMAFGSGVGSEVQKPFAIVIVGGMVSTVPTALLLLPLAYRWLLRCGSSPSSTTTAPIPELEAAPV